MQVHSRVELHYSINFDRFWDSYAKYLAAVQSSAPAELSPRAKDR